MNKVRNQVVEGEWVAFKGGELEGKRPKALCPQCREGLGRVAAGKAPRASRPSALCFQCYRAEIKRERALRAAGELDTASVARFQSALPFEPVNRPRLEMLKAERSAVRTAAMLQQGGRRFEERRRQAQIAARHALQQIAAGLAATSVAPPGNDIRGNTARAVAAAIHAAELQLPESWLPFVVSR